MGAAGGMMPEIQEAATMALVCTAAEAPHGAEDAREPAASAAELPAEAPPAPSPPSSQEEAWLARLEAVFAETRWPDA